MNLIGEFPVSVDNKGRLRLPSVLLRQLGDKPDDGKGIEFVVNKGTQKCLTLYPKQVWDGIAADLAKLNQFNEANMKFIRRFHAGAYPMESDSADRILLQKPLLDYAGLTEEAVLVAMLNRVEIWEPTTYEAYQNEVTEEYPELSTKVMGGGEAGVGQKEENSNTP